MQKNVHLWLENWFGKHLQPLIFLSRCFVFTIVCLTFKGALQAEPAKIMRQKTSTFPLDIEATQGITCDQHQKICTASGQVVATYGDYVLTCDRLIAHFKDGSAESMPQTLWKIEAQGQIKIRSTVNDQTIQGQVGTYNLETQSAILTGDNLELKVDGMVVTAKNFLEYRPAENIAMACGEAKAVQGERRLQADTLKAYFKFTPDQRQILSRLEGIDHVMIFTAAEIAQADRGVYDKEQDQAMLTNNVKIVRRDGVMEGDEATVNLKTGISSLRNNKETSRRVRVLMMPAQKKVSGS